jgi:dTDP-4-dehydrorhamnose reductase
MARIAILGANGMLGHVACRELSSSHEVIAMIRRTDAGHLKPILRANEIITGVDALDRRLETVLRSVAPQIVVNCVGLVKQRPEARDTMLAIEINALLPHRLARACDEIGAKLVHLSTDCVFSGKRGGYPETDVPDPVDTYGRSKLLGEVTAPPHLTLRTSMIGPQLEGEEGLVAWFLAQRGRAIKGYTRAIFSGLTTLALSRVIGEILERHPTLSGLYHLAAEPISKYDLLTGLAARFDWRDPIEPVDSPAIDRSLDGRRFVEATGIKVPSWNEMLDELAAELADTGLVDSGLAVAHS